MASIRGKSVVTKRRMSGYPNIRLLHSIAEGRTGNLGLVISLSSSGLLVQAMSGLVLIYSRAPKPGEYVHIKDVEGVVVPKGQWDAAPSVKHEDQETSQGEARKTGDEGRV